MKCIHIYYDNNGDRLKTPSLLRTFEYVFPFRRMIHTTIYT